MLGTRPPGLPKIDAPGLHESSDAGDPVSWYQTVRVDLMLIVSCLWRVSASARRCRRRQAECAAATRSSATSRDRTPSSDCS